MLALWTTSKLTLYSVFYVFTWLMGGERIGNDDILYFRCRSHLERALRWIL